MERSTRVIEDPSTSSSSSPVMRRKASYRSLESPSPSSTIVTFSFEPPSEEEPRHFLDSCTLCQRALGLYRDIFMYRGDMPFCSEDCRQEQIELDLAREEEEAAYWRSRSRSHRSSHHIRDPAAEVAEIQSMHARAEETAVTS